MTTKDRQECEEYSLPEQRHRLFVMQGGRGVGHVMHDSTLPAAKWPGRWTRRGVDRRTLCGSLSYAVVGVDVIDWPTGREPIADVTAVDCRRCIERYHRLFPETGHTRFTRDEATSTVAGDVRAIILWEITLRCGQVPDVHPRLLDGIESAARRIATEVVQPPGGQS